MAVATIVVETLIDTFDDVILKVNIYPDGNQDVPLTEIADVADFTTGRTGNHFHVKRVDWSLYDFAMRIHETTNPLIALLTLAPGSGNVVIPGESVTDAPALTNIYVCTTGLKLGRSGHFFIYLKKHSQ